MNLFNQSGFIGAFAGLLLTGERTIAAAPTKPVGTEEFEGDFILRVALTVAAPVTIALPPRAQLAASPGSRGFVIYDGAANAGTNAITIDAGAGNTIDGSQTYVINRNRGGVWLVLNADSTWRVFFAVNQGSGALAAHATTHQSGGSDVLTSHASTAANLVWAGPASGAAAGPSFRAPVVADLPANIIKKYKSAGRNGAGSLVATGVKVGDEVVAVIGVVTATGAVVDTLDSSGDFEATVTVVDQIQQSAAGDKSTNTYLFLVQPRS